MTIFSFLLSRVLSVANRGLALGAAAVFAVLGAGGAESAAATGERLTLGVYQQWVAFYDTEPPRCYAIAVARAEDDSTESGAEDSTDDSSDSSALDAQRGYISVGYWARGDMRGQFYARLPAPLERTARVQARIGAQRFALIHNGAHAWAQDADMDKRLIAAMRRGRWLRLVVSPSPSESDAVYPLAMVSSAIDAAALQCIAVERTVQGESK